MSFWKKHLKRTVRSLSRPHYFHNSVPTWRRNSPVKTTLLQAGLLPTFYQFTEALIEVKLSVTLKETSATQTGANSTAASIRKITMPATST